MELIEIDGAYGEGGGQIVRSAITLSCITKKPVMVKNIRKNRQKPGLKTQHLTVIKILAKICNAKVEGLSMGSMDVKFIPGEINQENDLTIDTKTASSISLILQSLILVTAATRITLKLDITGGTDVPFSPTINYIKYVVAKAYEKIGISFCCEITKRGYYPKGNGRVKFEISAFEKIKPIKLGNKNTDIAQIYCSYSQIKQEIINKEINDIIKLLEKNNIKPSVKIENDNALDKGASIVLSSIDEKSIIGYDALFNLKENKFPSSFVKDFIENDQSVDEHLSDMLVIPAGLNSDTSIFYVKAITKHLETNLFITSKITSCKYGIGKIKNGFEVRIKGI